MTDTSNPKDLVGRDKIPMTLFPPIAVAYGAVGMLEGKTKYGRNNFRGTDVRASIYVDAAVRHLLAWLEGENYTREGGHHLGNALATIAIILDAQTHGTLIDDRNFIPNDDEAYGNAMAELTLRAQDLVAGLRRDMEAKGKDKPLDWTAQTPRRRPDAIKLTMEKLTAEEQQKIRDELRATTSSAALEEVSQDPRYQRALSETWNKAIRTVRKIHPDEAMQLANGQERDQIYSGWSQQRVMNNRHAAWVKDLNILTEDEYSLFDDGVSLQDIWAARHAKQG